MKKIFMCFGVFFTTVILVHFLCLFLCWTIDIEPGPPIFLADFIFAIAATVATALYSYIDDNNYL